MSNILARILASISLKNNSTTNINRSSNSKDNIRKNISIDNIKYTVQDIDNIFPVLDIKPTSTIEEIMFNAGQRSVIAFLLSKEGRP